MPPLRALALAAIAAAVPAAASAQDSPPVLRGPHSFIHENALTAHGGFGVANQFSGARAGIGYGYQLAGSLWFDLRLDVNNGKEGPPVATVPCLGCAQVETFAAVMGGLSYRLRAAIPIIPYAGAAAGPIFLFNRGAQGAVGMGVRGSVGARYYVFEWLGFGAELGGMLAGAVVDETAGLRAGLVMMDLVLGAEFQF